MQAVQSTPNIAKTYARSLGGVLTLVGVLGFIPGITSNAPDGHLLGIFAVNPTHNIIHLLTGIVGLVAGFAADGVYARWFALAFGVVYALVTVIGFIQGTTVLGLIPTNLADNLLHVLITVASLAVYFTTNDQGTPATTTPVR
ncbi:MAG: DUF4383 domain-containing protein [Ktedonobacterales bacterium]|nr:DUF4383 domain-containing protein [Ktedonobacterales bacterium]